MTTRKASGKKIAGKIWTGCRIVSVIDRQEDGTVLTFALQVKNRVHLARIMRNIRKMPNVLRVSRDGTQAIRSKH